MRKISKPMSRVLSLLITVIMLLGMLPVSAFAATTSAVTSVENGQKYLIVSNEKALNSDLSSVDYSESMDITDAILWEADGDADGFKLKNVDNGKYLYLKSNWNQISLAADSSGTTEWKYDSGTNYLTGTSNNTTYYLYCSTSSYGGGFKVSDSDGTSDSNSSSRVVTMYLVTEGSGDHDHEEGGSGSETTTQTIEITTNKTASSATEDVEIAVDESITLQLTNGSGNARNHAISYTDSSVANVSAENNFNITGNGTEEITITGLKNGKTTITFTGTATNSSTIYYAVLNVTVGTGESGGSGNEGGSDSGETVEEVSITSAKQSAGGASADATIAVDQELTINLTNGSSDNPKNYTVTVDNESIAEVTSSKSFSLAASASTKVKVKGLANGTTTITMSGSGSGSTYVATINLTVTGESGGNGGTEGGESGGNGGETSTDGYTKVDTLTSGKKYVIVVGNVALGSEAGTSTNSDINYTGLKSVNVTIDGDKITDGVTESMIWEVTADGSKYAIKNEKLGTYLNVDYSGNSTSNFVRKLSLVSSNYDTWTYNSTLSTGDNNGNCYLIIVNDIFTVRSNSSTTPPAVSFYEVGAGTTVDPDQGGGEDDDDDTTTTDKIVVIAGSDYQDSNSKTYMTNLMTKIKETYPSVTGILMGGDYSSGYTRASDIEGVNSVISGVFADIKSVNRVFVQGNHDGKNMGKLTPSSSILSTTGEHDTAYYGVYSINDDDFDSAQTGLKSYLTDKADNNYSKPIFVATHRPLHKSNRGDNTNAKNLFKVMSDAAEKGLTIIYLFGHNHSQSEFDDYLGGGSVYLTNGDKITVAGGSTEDLNFTYMNYGYVGYCRNTADNALTMTAFEITGNKVIVKRYDQNGTHVLKAKGIASSGMSANERVYDSPQEISLTGGTTVEPEQPDTNAAWIKATALEDNKEYLIVGKNGNNYYALANNAAKTVSVSIDDDTVVLSDDDEKIAKWTTKAATDEDTQVGGNFTLANGNTFLARKSGDIIYTEDGRNTADDKEIGAKYHGFNFESDQLYNKSENSGSRIFYVKYDSDFTFGYYDGSTVTDQTTNVTLYVKSTSGTVTPDQPGGGEDEPTLEAKSVDIATTKTNLNSTSQKSVEIAVGQKLTISVTNGSSVERNYSITTTASDGGSLDDVPSTLTVGGSGTSSKTQTFTVTGKSAGTVVINLSNNNGSSTYVGQVTVNITGEACKHENTEVIPAKEATCSEVGLNAGEKCSDCGAITKAQTEIEKLPHTEETVPGKAATCTEDGLTEGVKCSVCDAVIEAQETIPAGHKFENGVCACGQKEIKKVSALEDGKKYVIVIDDYAMNATTGTTTTTTGMSTTTYTGLEAVEVEISNDVITSTVTNDMIWKVTKSGDKWALMNVSENKYLNAVYTGSSYGSSSSTSKVRTLELVETNYDTWTYSSNNLNTNNADDNKNKCYLSLFNDELFSVTSQTKSVYFYEVGETECAHEWNDATCTAPKTCKLCGATEGEALAPVYGDADVSWNDGYESAKVTVTCSVCKGAAEDHTKETTVDAEKTTVTATCQVRGSVTYKVEGTFMEKPYKETKTIEGDYGAHDLKTTAKQDSTCAEVGHQAYWSCQTENCGKHFSDANAQNEINLTQWLEGDGLIAKKAHTYGDVSVVFAEDGKKATVSVTCSACAEGAVGHTLTETVDTTVAGTTAGTCQEESTTTYKANGTIGGKSYDQNKVIKGAKGAHDLNPTAKKDSTCAEAGHQAYWSCKIENCGKHFSDAEAKNEIVDLETWLDGAGLIAKKAHTYGDVKVEFAADGKKATVSVTCTACAEGVEGHTLTETVNTTVVGSTAGTCQEEGTTTYKAMGTIGGKSYDKDITIDGAKGAHAPQKFDAKAATCAEAGHEAYWQCKTCNKYFSDANAQNEIENLDDWKIGAGKTDKLPHTYGDVSVVFAEDGLKATVSVTCTACAEGVEGHTLTETVNTTVVGSTAGTCQEEGTTTYKAMGTIGGKSYDQNKVIKGAKGAHDLNPTAKKDSTCAEAGHEAYWSCKIENCGKHFSDANAQNEITDLNAWLEGDGLIAKKAHTYGDVSVVFAEDGKKATVSVTCTACAEGVEGHTLTETVDTTVAGTTAGTCQEESTTTYNAKGEVGGKDFDQNKVIKGAKGAHALNPTAKKDSTCAEVGHEAYWSCKIENCGKHFSDAEAKNEITDLNAWLDGDGLIAKKAHTYGDAVVTWNEGYKTAKVTVTCSKCDATAEGHTKETTATATETTVTATCQVRGSVTYKVEGTFEGKSYMATETVTGDYGAHNLNPTAKKDSTCAEVGHQAYWSCQTENCGKHFSDANAQNEITDLNAWLDGAGLIAKKAHTYGDAVVTWNDGYESAKVTVTCSKCDENAEGHIMETTVISTKTEGNATCQVKGSATYVVEGTFMEKPYKATKTIEGQYGAHDLKPTAKKDSTCTAVGHQAYWQCQTCNKYFSDAEAKNVIDDLDAWKTGVGKIDKLAPVYGDAVVIWNDGYETAKVTVTCSACNGTAEGHTKEIVATATKTTVTATCQVKGSVTYVVEGTIENKSYKDTKVIEGDFGAHNLVKVDEKPATCTETGIAAYWSCQTKNCGKHFSDAEAKNVIDDLDAWKTGDGKIEKKAHTEVIDDAKAPTCTETGLSEGKKCTVCGVVTVSQTEIPMINHSYEDGKCTMCGAADPDQPEDDSPILVGATATLGESLAINFVIDTAKLDGAGHYAVIQHVYADGSEATPVVIRQANWTQYDGSLYYFSFKGIAAKEMTDKMIISICDSTGKAVIEGYKDSLRDYAMRALAKEEAKDAPDAEKLTLYVDMLNYGAAAQVKFDYNTSDLANKDLTAAQKAYATSQAPAVTKAQLKGDGYAGSTLTLESEIQLNFVYNNDAISDVAYAVATWIDHYGYSKSSTISVSDFEEFDSSRTYIGVKGLVVADYNQQVTLKLYNADGDEVSTSKDSIGDYVTRAANAGNLDKMILYFGASAYASFH